MMRSSLVAGQPNNSKALAQCVMFIAWAFGWALRIIAIGVAACIIGMVLFFGTWIAWGLFWWFWWMSPALGLGSAVGMAIMVALVGKWMLEGVRWAHKKAS